MTLTLMNIHEHGLVKTPIAFDSMVMAWSKKKIDHFLVPIE